ncbi:hypothetical protein [Alkalihalobacillus pseudalcaliphilus]|uniref:hypothetical protein n=1 Tax=Alkalihalobacillus pseudalcaliphilus TaxID=79884 RepID=UPI00069F4647
MKEAGIPTQVAIAPVLPSGEQFAKQLKPLVSRVCLDDYFIGDGSGGKRTKRLGIENKYSELQLKDWYDTDAIERVYDRFIQIFTKEQVFISQAGFEP